MIFKKAHLDDETVTAKAKSIREDTAPELRDPKALKDMCQALLDNPGYTHNGLQNETPTVSFESLADLFEAAETRYYELGGTPPFPQLNPNEGYKFEDLFR